MSEFKDLHKFFGQHQPPPLPPQPPPPQLPQPPPQHPQHHQRGAANHGSFTGAGSNSLTNFFPESEPFPDNDFRSFSDLLAGALATPLPGTGELNLGLDNYSWGADHRAEKSNRNNNNNGNNNSNNNGNNNDANNNDANNNDVNANNGVGFKQNRPGSLVLPPVAPVFNVSPGFSPSAFLTSPTFLSPLGMSPQQTLAHITAQAAHSALSHQAHLTSIQPADTTNNNNNNPPSFPSTTTAAPPPYQPPIFNTGHHQHGRAPQHSFPAAVDKPADDGYNWRKYGQKQVKGSEYPRSYYRCTTPNCPVKKKVERSYDGHITEIIYKGQHNHGRPQNGRRGNKDTNNTGCLLGGDSLWPGGANNNNNNNVQYDSAQATSMQLHGPSDSEESAENSQHLLDDGDGDDEDDDDDDDDDYNDQPRAKRRKGGGGVREGGYTHRTMTEPKIVVQTRSDVDLLDDGYRWRKYGQKVVKGNPNPRSYYKCTTAGCKVRKHVERASTDASAVITTYEGKHNHDVPATRGSSSNNNNNNNNNNFQPTQMKLHNNSAVAQMSFGNNNNNNDQRPMTLRLKEEQLVL